MKVPRLLAEVTAAGFICPPSLLWLESTLSLLWVSLVLPPFKSRICQQCVSPSGALEAGTGGAAAAGAMRHPCVLASLSTWEGTGAMVRLPVVASLPAGRGHARCSNIRTSRL